jgi:hypothetical protein
MTAQLSLYEAQLIAAPYQPASETSAAAASQVSNKVPTQKERILSYVASRGEYGATQDEIEVATGYLRSAVCGRVNALENEQAIRKSGETRASRWGAQCAVYVTGPSAVRTPRGDSEERFEVPME